jgi:uroporphyrinogen decarboxylase
MFAFDSAAHVASALAGPNTYIIYHAAEASIPRAKLQAQLPVSALNLGEGISIAALRRELGAGKCLMGNFDPLLLRDGTPDQVAEATRTMIRENTRAGGYVFNTGEGITPDTPPDNVTAMTNAVREGWSCG